MATTLSKEGTQQTRMGNTVLGTASLQMQVTVGLTVRVGIFGFIVCYLFGVCVHAMTHVGEQSEGNLWGLGLPFGIRLRSSSLTVKHLYALSHHTGPSSILETVFM